MVRFFNPKTAEKLHILDPAIEKLSNRFLNPEIVTMVEKSCISFLKNKEERFNKYIEIELACDNSVI